jgi:phosphate/sulfate permease
MLGGLLNERKVCDADGRTHCAVNSHTQGISANLVTGFLVISASQLSLPVSTTHVFAVRVISESGMNSSQYHIVVGSGAAARMGFNGRPVADSSGKGVLVGAPPVNHGNRYFQQTKINRELAAVVVPVIKTGS